MRKFRPAIVFKWLKDYNSNLIGIGKEKGFIDPYPKPFAGDSPTRLFVGAYNCPEKALIVKLKDRAYAERQVAAWVKKKFHIVAAEFDRNGLITVGQELTFSPPLGPLGVNCAYVRERVQTFYYPSNAGIRLLSPWTEPTYLHRITYGNKTYSIYSMWKNLDVPTLQAYQDWTRSRFPNLWTK